MPKCSSTRFARLRLVPRPSGVDIRLEVYPDMVHVWHLMRAITPAAQRAIDEIGVFVRERTAIT